VEEFGDTDPKDVVERTVADRASFELAFYKEIDFIRLRFDGVSRAQATGPNATT
jgi:hypothetical protein